MKSVKDVFTFWNFSSECVLYNNLNKVHINVPPDMEKLIYECGTKVHCCGCLLHTMFTIATDELTS